MGSEIGKKQNKEIPKIISNNKEYFLGYLTGLVDTDGNVEGNRIQLKQKSQKLLTEIEQNLRILRLNPSASKVNYTNKKPFYYIRFDKKIPLRLK